MEEPVVKPASAANKDVVAPSAKVSTRTLRTSIASWLSSPVANKRSSA